MAVINYERKRTRKIPIGWIIIITAAIGIIIFAFIWEATRNKESEFDGYYIEPTPEIISPVQERIGKLDWITEAYLPVNIYSRPGTELKEVNAIVIHYVGNPGTTAKQNRNYFANLPKTADAYLSSNFIVGLEGEILQCVPVDEIAYASNNRNDDTLSIETCHPDATGKFNEETYESLVRLTAWLCRAYDLTTDDVIRHYDITGKECPKYFVDNEDEWKAFKNDIVIEMYVQSKQSDE